MTRASDVPSIPPGTAAPWQRPESRIRPATALGDRLVLECARAAREGIPFSLLGVQHLLWQEDGEESRAALRRHVRENVADKLRVSDAVFDAGLPGCHVVVLPHTSPACAGVALARLEAHAAEVGVTDLGPVSLDAIPFAREATDAASVMAAISSHFHERSLRQLDTPALLRPASRLPVGDVARLEEALRTEINLAGRSGAPLAVVALRARDDHGRVAGLLAFDVDAIAARTIRGCDQAFELGPSCVVLILPRTAATEASAVVDRVARELLEEHPDAPYGAPHTATFEFDLEHRDTAAFLAALHRFAD